MADQIIAAGVKAHIAEILIEGRDTIYAMNLVGGLTSLNAINAAINMSRPMQLDRTGNPGAEIGEQVKMGFSRKGWRRIGPTIIDREKYPGLYHMIVYHSSSEAETKPEDRIQDDSHPILMLTIISDGANKVDDWFAMLNERMHRTPMLEEWKQPLYNYYRHRAIVELTFGGNEVRAIRTGISQIHLRNQIVRLARHGTISAPTATGEEDE